VARSANAALAPVAAIVLLAGALGGCSVTTTQTKDARLTVKADRTLAKPPKADAIDHGGDVEVTQTAIVRGDKDTAIAVRVRNTSSHPVNDVPLLVGIHAKGGKDEYVNLEKGVSYFQSHVPSIAPDSEETWIFASKKEVPEGEPFAKVGEPADPPLTVAKDLPALDVSQELKPTGKGSANLEVKVANPSDVPQYELELYAWAEDGKKLVAAGTANVTELESGATATVHLPLVGDPGKAPVEVFVPPTIFQ
jgi:hypothetical protein